MTDHRVAVLGCGAWGQNLVRNFYQLGVLAAIADPSESGQQTARQLAPGVPVLTDPLAAIADPTLEAVVIATPAVTHAELMLAALAAGKDVFCEKQISGATSMSQNRGPQPDPDGWAYP